MLALTTPDRIKLSGIMTIGIDVSQVIYGTGVSNYLENFVDSLLRTDRKNNYILFASSLRQNPRKKIGHFAKRFPNVTLKTYRLPPKFLSLLWNTFHIVPIEHMIGSVDLFISSDWTEPPSTKAIKATIIYDMIVYKYPNETEKNIIVNQKRKLQWVKKESSTIFCISVSTKHDIMEILGINEGKIHVIYPGI